MLGAARGRPDHALRARTCPALLRLVRAFDAERLTRLFLSDWARMGPVEFLESRVAPLVRAVGEAWEKGELEIRHEHFLSERIGDLLGSLRLPFEERATGPLVVYATLPGEAHALGLQMAALVLAAGGCRSLYLGTEVPVAQTAALARDLGARAVAISVSPPARARRRRRPAQAPRSAARAGGAARRRPGRARGAARRRDGVEPARPRCLGPPACVRPACGAWPPRGLRPTEALARAAG